MAKLSAPVIYGLLIAGGGILYLLTGGDAPKSSKPPATKVAAKADDTTSDYTQADYATEFGRSTADFRDLFMPVVKTTVATTVIPADLNRDTSKLPADVAEGDPNWAYTSYVKVDNVDEAVLENTSTHQGALVKQGDLW
jgi:hypothetical protein